MLVWLLLLDADPNSILISFDFRFLFRLLLVNCDDCVSSGNRCTRTHKIHMKGTNLWSICRKSTVQCVYTVKSLQLVGFFSLLFCFDSLKLWSELVLVWVGRSKRFSIHSSSLFILCKCFFQCMRDFFFVVVVVSLWRHQLLYAFRMPNDSLLLSFYHLFLQLFKYFWTYIARALNSVKYANAFLLYLITGDNFLSFSQWTESQQ